MPDVTLIGSKPSNIYVTLNGSMDKTGGMVKSYPEAVDCCIDQLCTYFLPPKALLDYDTDEVPLEMTL